MNRFKNYMPEWVQEWLEILIPSVQIVLIIFAAWLVYRLFRRILARAGKRYALTPELLVPLRGVVRWILIVTTVLIVLERLGVSATVLWTAFTGFATVGAVAFFAAWSVLSNLFCAMLIVTVGPFRLGDYIEVLDTAEKPGAKGRVVDINLLYTTLEDHHHAGPDGTWLQIPNALIFQRVVRRWRGPPPAAVDHSVPAAPTLPAASAPVQESPPATPAP